MPGDHARLTSAASARSSIGLVAWWPVVMVMFAIEALRRDPLERDHGQPAPDDHPGAPARARQQRLPLLRLGHDADRRRNRRDDRSSWSSTVRSRETWRCGRRGCVSAAIHIGLFIFGRAQAHDREDRSRRAPELPRALLDRLLGGDVTGAGNAAGGATDLLPVGPVPLPRAAPCGWAARPSPCRTTGTRTARGPRASSPRPVDRDVGPRLDRGQQDHDHHRPGRSTGGRRRPNHLNAPKRPAHDGRVQDHQHRRRRTE